MMLRAKNDGCQLKIYAEYNGVTVGTVEIQISLDEAYIHDVFVSDKVRRQGIARQMLCELERQLPAQTERIILDVRVGNIPAIELYKSQGFKEIVRRKGFYYEPCEDGITMEKIVIHGRY